MTNENSTETEWTNATTQKTNGQKMIETAQEIESSVTKKQCQILFDLAKESRNSIVELGSWKGRSSVVLAAGSIDGHKIQVYCIDTWENCDIHPYKDFFPEWSLYIKWLGLDDIVTAIKMDISRASREVKWEPISLLFIDAWHTYESTKNNFNDWIKLLDKDGVVVFHDYCEPWSGVIKFVDELRNNDFYVVLIKEGMAIVRWK